MSKKSLSLFKTAQTQLDEMANILYRKGGQCK